MFRPPLVQVFAAKGDSGYNIGRGGVMLCWKQICVSISLSLLLSSSAMAAGEHQTWEQFLQQYPGPKADTVNKDAWVADYFKFATTEVPRPVRHEFLAYSGSALFVLYPELSFSQVERKLIRAAEKAGWRLSSQNILQIAEVSPPELCPEKTLLTAETAKGPFRPAQQKFGICYVYAGTRALDYFSFSFTHANGSTPFLTSVLATAMSDNARYTSKGLNLEWGGYPENIVERLMTDGGCPLTAWDQLPGSEGEERLDQLKLAFEELDQTVAVWKTGDRTGFYQRMSQWSLATKEIVSALTKTDSTSSAQHSSFEELLAKLESSGFVSSKDSHFMARADLIFRRAFCQSKPVVYPQGHVRVLLRTRDRVNSLHPFQLAAGVSFVFSETNPQPLMISFFADPLKDVRSRTRSIAHAALIVGQRYNQSRKSCEYQILDSNPPEFWDPGLVGDAATGSLWLPLWALNRSLFKMSIIEPGAAASVRSVQR